MTLDIRAAGFNHGHLPRQMANQLSLHYQHLLHTSTKYFLLASAANTFSHTRLASLNYQDVVTSTSTKYVLGLLIAKTSQSRLASFSRKHILAYTSCFSRLPVTTSTSTKYVLGLSIAKTSQSHLASFSRKHIIPRTSCAFQPQGHYHVHVYRILVAPFDCKKLPHTRLLDTSPFGNIMSGQLFYVSLIWNRAKTTMSASDQEGGMPSRQIFLPRGRSQSSDVFGMV